MKNHVTTIEQSRRLLELGVAPEKASMVCIVDYEDGVLDWKYITEQNGKYYLNQLAMDDLCIEKEGLIEVNCYLHDAETGYYDHSYRRDFPAFTVADLLGMIPKVLESSRPDMMLYLSITSDGEKWAVCWINHATHESQGETFRSDDLVALLCDRIEWLLSNGYKLNV